MSNIFKKIFKAIKSLFCGNKKEEVIKQELPFVNYVWSIDRLNENIKNEDIIKQLIWKSNNRYIDEQPILIIDKPNKFVEDTHYYVSLAPYYWPNPDTNNGLPYIVKDCDRNPECDLYDYPKIVSLVNKMRVLSLTYYFTNNPIYYNCAIEQINAWFINKDTYMYPEIEYCQIGPGVNNNKGINTLDMYDMIYVFESIALLNSTTQLPDDMLYTIKEWIKKHIKSLETSKAGAFENRMKNNHGIAYDVYLIYLYILGYGEVNNKIVNRLKERIKSQILTNGEQPEELNRNAGMHYSIYNLDHIIDVMKILDKVNDPFEYEYVHLIDEAFEFLYQFTTLEDFKNAGYNEVGDWVKIMDYLDREAGRINFTEYDFAKKEEFIIL